MVCGLRLGLSRHELRSGVSCVGWARGPEIELTPQQILNLPSHQGTPSGLGVRGKSDRVQLELGLGLRLECELELGLGIRV